MAASIFIHIVYTIRRKPLMSESFLDPIDKDYILQDIINRVSKYKRYMSRVRSSKWFRAYIDNH